MSKLPGFDIVSCQFAMHYFFKDSKSLENVLILISSMLQPGGYFIGTCMDAKNIIENFSKYAPGSRKTLDRPLYTIEKKFTKNTTDKFGNEYSFFIKDSQQDKAMYFNVIGKSVEYLVHFDKLTELASKYLLEPVKINVFEKDSETQELLRPPQGSNITLFEDLYENYITETKKTQLSDDEQELSFLNRVFIFKKK
jgi:mRNA (guanine-N7-)-methyltransferase